MVDFLVSNELRAMSISAVAYSKIVVQKLFSCMSLGFLWENALK